MPDRPLDGRIALVTGSTSGIGLGIATALAEQGCTLAINGFGETAGIERLRTELAENNRVDVRHFDADLVDPEQASGLVRRVTEDFGKIDILCNNAGVQFVSPIVDFPADKWDHIIALNLSAAFHATKAALPQMIDRKWGRIVNTASINGMVATANKAAYVSAKHGLIGLTKVTALEVAELGITCNAICPGSVLTPLSIKQSEDIAAAEGITVEEATRRRLHQSQPNKRHVETSEIGALAAFLCSEGARSITGATLPVDGAKTAD